MKAIFKILEVIAPFFLLFWVFPHLKTLLRDIFDIEDPKKKKKERKQAIDKHMRQIGSYRTTPPPPPKPRTMGSHKDFEVRDGKIVRKHTHTHEQKIRDMRDGKYVDSNGKTMIKQTDEDMKDWNWYLEESESNKRGVVKEETPKKKQHFSKGVDPDFL
jgi:hypothetical protein